MDIHNLKPKEYVKASELLYSGILKDIKKAKNPYQAIWEGITNAIEGIRDRGIESGKISIRMYFKTILNNEIPFFDCIEIEDNGIGFNDKNFGRFLKFKDNTKGPKNNGSGRLQLLHTFKVCHFQSVFSSDSIYYQRTFSLSQDAEYLNNNAIVFYDNTTNVNASEPCTILRMCELREKVPCYDTLTPEELKNTIRMHYMSYFCSNRNAIPLISIERYIDGIPAEKENLTSSDFPDADKRENLPIYYSTVVNDKIIKSPQKADFVLECFKIGDVTLPANEIHLVSKGEVIEKPRIDFELLAPKDNIDGYRYLVFLSGDYIDSLVGDIRGEVAIPSQKEYENTTDLWHAPAILLEDIAERINTRFNLLYPEVVVKEEERDGNVAALKDMFLLNPNTLKKLSFGINDTPEMILKKVYKADSEIMAKADAEIKQNIEELNSLNPTDSGFLNKFEQQIKKLVVDIPLQNRTVITHYVARRKLVLELFGKALDKKLNMQKDEDRNIDEKILHNIIFQQSSKNPEQSDLWLLNEDFIYFAGCSEKKLCDVEINGEKLFKSEFADKEEEYLLSLGENRKIKRPDVLLFPAESKCIIIEFKNPIVNVSDYLNQIVLYASLIRQFSIEKYQIDTFYGYLIGEAINARDVRNHDAEFKEAYNFDYLFRAHKTISGDARKDGSLYTEVIKYSTLLERAKKRNKIFIEKLMAGITS